MQVWIFQHDTKCKRNCKRQVRSTLQRSKFIIPTKNELIKSISYIDEFENKVKIVFENQKQNEDINNKLFIPTYPLEFDIIRD